MKRVFQAVLSVTLAGTTSLVGCGRSPTSTTSSTSSTELVPQELPFEAPSKCELRRGVLKTEVIAIADAQRRLSVALRAVDAAEAAALAEMQILGGSVEVHMEMVWTSLLGMHCASSDNAAFVSHYQAPLTAVAELRAKLYDADISVERWDQIFFPTMDLTRHLLLARAALRSPKYDETPAVDGSGDGEGSNDGTSDGSNDGTGDGEGG